MYIQPDLDKSYWDERYRQNQAGWDIGHAAPALVDYCSQLVDRSIEILIPGCGYGHEVMELIALGFNHITVIDLSDTALNQLATKAGDRARLVQGDFFEWDGQYDLIIEQTFFCAIDPSLRKRYAEKMHSLLKPAGKLMGLLFNRPFDGGPPFGGSREEYVELFSPLFTIGILEPCYNSIKPREGTELFMEMIKK